ncbi:TPA: hypothetical protein OMI62_004722 [Escherichia coli]|nr:hypothetical protein [Escherichia coli]
MKTEHGVLSTKNQQHKYVFAYAESHFLLCAINEMLLISGHNKKYIYLHEKPMELLEDIYSKNKKNISIVLFIDIRSHIELLMKIRVNKPNCNIIVISKHALYIDHIISKHYGISVTFSKEHYPEDVINYMKSTIDMDVTRAPSIQKITSYSISDEIQIINKKVNSDLYKIGLTQKEISILYFYSFGININIISSKMKITTKQCYSHLHNIKVKLSGKVSFGKLHFDYIWVRLESQKLI